MKTKKHGHYVDYIPYVGRTVKVEIIRIKNTKFVDGHCGTKWIGQIDDKQLIKRHDFETIEADTYNECKQELMDWLLLKGIDELDKNLRKCFGSTTPPIRGDHEKK